MDKSIGLCGQREWPSALGSGVVFHLFPREPGFGGTSWKWAYGSQFHRGIGHTPLPCQDEI